MGDNTKPEGETIDLSVTEQMRSLCAQFDEECETALRAGRRPGSTPTWRRFPNASVAAFGPSWSKSSGDISIRGPV